MATSSIMDPARWSGRIWIGGEWREGRDGERPLVSPATGEPLGTIGYASAEDVDEAVSIAAKAQKAWAATPFDERASILRRAGDMFLANNEEIKDWLAAESGSARFKVAASPVWGLRSVTRPPRWRACRSATCCGPMSPV